MAIEISNKMMTIPARESLCLKIPLMIALAPIREIRRGSIVSPVISDIIYFSFLLPNN